MRNWTWRKLEGPQPDIVEVLNRRMLDLTHYLKATRDRQQGVRTLASADATPSASGASILVTANSGATTITGIDDGQRGWQIVIIAGDANTTLQHGSNLQLIGNANWTMASGDVVVFVTEDGTVWRETPQPARWS